MKNYEMINIIDVAWEDGDIARAEEMISREVAKAGGEKIDIGTMGRLKLAYPINDHTEGNYLLSHFILPPDRIPALRDSLKLNQAVIRSLIVRDNKRPLIALQTETIEEYEERMPEREIPETITGDSIDEGITLNPEAEHESFDDIEVNLESLPVEDITGPEKKEV